MLLVLLTACLGSEAPSPADAPYEAPTSPESSSQPPNLVVILIDTLREDALLRAETPNIDALRNSGTSADHAWSAGTWTVPSIMSLFTGKSVRGHGWDEPSARLGHYPVMGDHPTLAERLMADGFETTGYYANHTATLIMESFFISGGQTDNGSLLSFIVTNNGTIHT